MFSHGETCPILEVWNTARSKFKTVGRITLPTAEATPKMVNPQSHSKLLAHSERANVLPSLRSRHSSQAHPLFPSMAF